MAKGSGPIQYNELFNNDVDAKLAELSGIVSKLDSEFQGLATTITKMSGKVSVNIKTTNTELEKMATDMSAVDVATRGAGDQLQKYSKDLQDASTKTRNLKDFQGGLNTVFNASIASVDEIKAQVKLLTAEYTSLGRATDADKAKMAALAKEVGGLKAQQETLTSALNRTKVVVDAADGSYNQMSQRLAQLKKELFAMPNAFDPATGAINKANKEAVSLNKEISQLDTSLKKADASMGVYGRNVGNYKSGFNGLGNSINQISRELPAFTFSAQTGFLALSNNLPILADNISQTKNRITELRAAGEKVPSLFSQISGAIFSWQTLLSVGVTLITVYGKEIGNLISKLFQGEKAFDTIAANMTLLNDVTKSTNAEFAKQSTQLRILYQTATDINASDEQRIKAIRELQRLWPETYGNLSDEVILKGQAKTATDDLTKSLYEQAKARAALSKIEALAAKQLDADFQIQKINNARRSELARAAPVFNVRGDLVSTKENEERIINERADAAIKIENQNKKILGDQIAFLENLAGGSKKIAEVIATTVKEVADSELTSIEDIRKRIAFLSKLPESAIQDSAIDKRIDALKARLKDADIERKKMEAAEKKAEKEREAAAQKAIKDADDLLKAQTKLKIAELEKQEIADLSTATEEQKTQIIIQFEKDKLKVIEDGINAREKLYKKGTDEFVALEAEKVNAANDAQEKINKTTEDGLNRQLALQQKYGKLRKDLLESQDQGSYAAAEFAITSKVYKGNPQQQEAQKQDALYNLRRDALKRELTLVDVRNKTIKDATERELISTKEKQDIINQINELGYENFLRLQDRTKAKLAEMFSYLRDNSSIIGQLYGQGFGDLFDSLTTNLQKMVEGTGNTLADWAETVKAGARAANDVFRQGSEERISMLEEEKQTQMDIAGSNKDARLAIEKAFNDKIKQEKIKQARIDKATAIFEIAINTAVAASKATAQTGIFGLPLAAVLIAFGAIQAGLVAAKPLPAFRKGTNSAPEGFARVGEEGAELIEGKRGLRIAHSDQITYLDRGDKVYTAEQTRKILDTNQIDSNTDLHGRLATNLHQQSSQQRIKEMSIAFRQDPEAIGDAVGRRIKDLPIHQTYFDERGVSRYIRKNGTLTKYLNDRTSLS